MRGTPFAMALAALTLAVAKAAIKEDEIKDLPGWSGPLPSRQWSGYLTVPGDHGDKKYHYWFAESEGDPKKDPVALWLNGGPGSSSLIGLLTENGPFIITEESVTSPLAWGDNDTVPQLFYRKYGWTQAASVIWLESPAGVGFSYCDYPLNKTSGAPLFPCTANDTSTALDNKLVLQHFFAGFPEFAKNEFYITGESYAGVYIPTLVEQIEADPESGINLKGIAVGNGCWGSDVGLCTFGPDMDRIWQMFLHGHSATSIPQFKAIVKSCGDPADGPGAWSNCTGQGDVCSNMKAPSDRYASDACQSALNNASKSEYPGNYEIYNYYDTCYATSGLTTKTMTYLDRAAHLAHLRNGGEFGAAVHVGQAPATVGGALNDYSCGGFSAMSKWLAHPAVVKALHVNPAHPYPGAVAYGPRMAGDLRATYKSIAQKYKMMIYSGDTDACVPTVGTEEWTEALGFSVVENAGWRPWHAGTNQNATAHFITAGYVVEYEAGTTTKPHNFTFATIKGAGHTVPEFKPVPMLTLLTRYFKGLPHT